MALSQDILIADSIDLTLKFLNLSDVTDKAYIVGKVFAAHLPLAFQGDKNAIEVISKFSEAFSQAQGSNQLAIILRFSFYESVEIKKDYLFNMYYQLLQSSQNLVLQ